MRICFGGNIANVAKVGTKRLGQSCRSTDTIPLSYANFDVQLMPRVRERQ